MVSLARLPPPLPLRLRLRRRCRHSGQTIRQLTTRPFEPGLREAIRGPPRFVLGMPQPRHRRRSRGSEGRGGADWLRLATHAPLAELLALEGIQTKLRSTRPSSRAQFSVEGYGIGGGRFVGRKPVLGVPFAGCDSVRILGS